MKSSFDLRFYRLRFCQLILPRTRSFKRVEEQDINKLRRQSPVVDMWSEK